jgi:uncharacterized OB-fold protein
MSGRALSGDSPLAPVGDLGDQTEVIARADDGTLRLVASVCPGCATAWFPAGAVCPSCARLEPERYLVGPTGTLYSYTTVHVSSSRPTPYVLGYVDLDQGVRVLGTIEATPGALAVDARCRLDVADDGAWRFVVEVR